MKKLLQLIAFFLFTSLAMSCSDAFEEEFQELHTETTDQTGGSVGGDDQMDPPD